MTLFRRLRASGWQMAALAAAVLAAQLLRRTALSQDRGACFAARVVGDATVRREAATIAVRPGMALAQGDRLAAGDGARVEVRCPDGSVLTVGERTTVSLSIFIAGRDRPHSAVLELLEGILRTMLPTGHAWERFDIVTRTAVASVRSTTWIVEAKPDTTAVFVQEGGVLVSSRANRTQVFLTPGLGTDAGTGPERLEAKPWGQARIDDVLARTRMP